MGGWTLQGSYLPRVCYLEPGRLWSGASGDLIISRSALAASQSGACKAGALDQIELRGPQSSARSGSACPEDARDISPDAATRSTSQPGYLPTEVGVPRPSIAQDASHSRYDRGAPGRAVQTYDPRSAPKGHNRAPDDPAGSPPRLSRSRRTQSPRGQSGGSGRNQRHWQVSHGYLLHEFEVST